MCPPSIQQFCVRDDTLVVPYELAYRVNRRADLGIQRRHLKCALHRVGRLLMRSIFLNKWKFVHHVEQHGEDDPSPTAEPKPRMMPVK